MKELREELMKEDVSRTQLEVYYGLAISQRAAVEMVESRLNKTFGLIREESLREIDDS